MPKSLNYSGSLLFGTNSVPTELGSVISLTIHSDLRALMNSSFLNQHFLTDYNTKVSYIDVILVFNSWNTWFNCNTLSISLYNNFNHELVSANSIYYLPIYSLVQSEFQDRSSDILLITPELPFSFVDYTRTYVLTSSFVVSVSAVFDAYQSIWTPLPLGGVETSTLLLFFGYVAVHISFLLSYLVPNSSEVTELNLLPILNNSTISPVKRLYGKSTFNTQSAISTLYNSSTLSNNFSVIDFRITNLNMLFKKPDKKPDKNGKVLKFIIVCVISFYFTSSVMEDFIIKTVASFFCPFCTYCQCLYRSTYISLLFVHGQSPHFLTN